MSTPDDPATIGARIVALIHDIGTLEDSRAKTQTQELVRLLMTLYGTGLSHMLDIVGSEGGGSQAVLDRFAGDGLISSLLVLHDLHPHPVGVRVERALAGLQPHLPRHTNLILVDIKEDVVRLRIDHGASGVRPPAGNVRTAIERAIQEAAPEIGVIEIEGPGNDGDVLLQIIRGPATDAARPTGA